MRFNFKSFFSGFCLGARVGLWEKTIQSEARHQSMKTEAAEIHFVQKCRNIQLIQLNKKSYKTYFLNRWASNQCFWQNLSCAFYVHETYFWNILSSAYIFLRAILSRASHWSGIPFTSFDVRMLVYTSINSVLVATAMQSICSP